jgi:translation initiation factor IF-2
MKPEDFTALAKHELRDTEIKTDLYDAIYKLCIKYTEIVNAENKKQKKSKFKQLKLDI